MQSLPINLAQAGMTLDRDIMAPNNANGIPIIGKGSQLTAQSIERLKKLGVLTITVSGHPVTLPGEETREQALADLEYRFGAVNNNPYMMRILDLFRTQISHRYDKAP